MAGKKQKIEFQGIFVSLQLCLFFLIGFFALGSPVLFSLLMGVIGGIAGGLIFIWWHSPEEEQDKKKLSDEAEELKKSPVKKASSRIVQAQRKRKIRERTTPKGRIKFPRLPLLSRRKK